MEKSDITYVISSVDNKGQEFRTSTIITDRYQIKQILPKIEELLNKVNNILEQNNQLTEKLKDIYNIIISKELKVNTDHCCNIPSQENKLYEIGELCTVDGHCTISQENTLDSDHTISPKENKLDENKLSIVDVINSCPNKEVIEQKQQSSEIGRYIKENKQKVSTLPKIPIPKKNKK